jgi:hypothetical protein
MFETLQNFAEIGIAIAGFSAIASALGSRVVGRWSSGDRIALLSLLETSAFVVCFALIPQVLDQIMRNERTLWVSCNLAYVSTHAFHCFVQARRAITLRAAGEEVYPVVRRVGRVLFIGAILLIGTQAAFVIFGNPEQLRFIYLAVLMWHSCVAGIMFGSLILRLLESDAA